ncbi:relaxase domain-containing protein [Georgenia satyanarayanai]|uniref:MobF family relaxase n=1 Tax=Georgenia satyanarayanai TaxID=860221 RepID=UPI00203DFF9C|nr:MobF family relaxase [Georgenia satyanarayanai]MCM3662382.1 relaxase domain-containing protein [Georgenia satyanarayanai]
MPDLQFSLKIVGSLRSQKSAPAWYLPAVHTPSLSSGTHATNDVDGPSAIGRPTRHFWGSVGCRRTSTEVVIRVHGGVKFYRGAAKSARAYVERDRSRADDYYLGEGTGVAERFTATSESVGHAGSMDGETYEHWVAGTDIDTGRPKGWVRQDANALRFVEVTVNGPKTWSLAAALHPEVSAALDDAQDRAAAEIVSWVAQHATTRVGPRGQQVQVPVEQIEAAVIRHYTSRAGDPHRHLHLQINARVYAAGAWRGIHSIGIRDSIEAINGIGHAAVATNPQFRAVLAAHGLTLDPATNEIRQLIPYVGAFSARTAQIRRNVDRYEAAWRSTHRGEEPGPRLREAWDRRAWAEARPDKVVPKDGRDLVARWNGELRELGYRDPARPVPLTEPRPGWIDRDAAADLVVSILGAKRSAWNTADIRGTTEVLLAQTGLVAEPAARGELAEDITARTVRRCVTLLDRTDVPEHIRSFTSSQVLEVEADVVARMARRAHPAHTLRLSARGPDLLDPAQAAVIGALAGDGPLVVVEGAAGGGKTTALRATQHLLSRRGHRLMVVTPTLKAAEVAAAETGADGHSAAWLIHQHGWRWDADGHWTRRPSPAPDPSAQLRPRDLLLVDEAGMLDQDTARALLTIADEAGARVAFVGDRHQLPAVGRGGVLDHAAAWAHPTAIVTLEKVRRFADPEYAALSLRMRTGDDAGRVFDALHRRGHIAIHASDVERTAALAAAGASGDLVIADTREQVADLNAAIRHQRHHENTRVEITTASGDRIGIGDRVATRRNDPDLQVANRQTWTVARVGRDGSLLLHRRGRDREIPAVYATRFVELAYATTVHGAQGSTVTNAHVAIGEHTGAASAYVAMTRGRQTNVAHLVAENLDVARGQWIEIFSRARADLGPALARRQAREAIDRYGPRRRQPVTAARDRGLSL